jgi:hypothetical protein
MDGDRVERQVAGALPGSIAKFACAIALASSNRFCDTSDVSRLIRRIVDMVNHARFERLFYLTATVGFLLLVFWTFARTYFLKFLFETPTLPPLLHVHAIVMSGWVVLLALQSALVTARRVSWHRRIGVFGAVWAALLVVVGSVTTVHAAVREVRGHTAMAAPQVIITTLDLAQMALFAGLVTVAIWQRRRPAVHKRLMLLTIACMLPDALARLPVSFMTNELILVGLYGFVIACVGIDTVRHRRLHPAFGWGALVLLGTFTVLLFVAITPQWIAFGTRLFS